MRALPFLFSLLAAALLAPTLLARLARAGRLAENYRGRRLPSPLGLLVPPAALCAVLASLLIAAASGTTLLAPDFGALALYALGVVCLGLIDDAFGAGGPRGLRGHAAATLRGRPSTGALKAVGSATLGWLALTKLGYSGVHLLLATAVLVLATHVFNLLDLRPGRAVKVFVVLGALLAAASATLVPLWSFGPLAGPALVAGGYDLRERALLGDTGSNLLGALAGLWLVLGLRESGQLLALVLLCVLTVYGERNSFSELVERTPLLRGLDSLGRPA